MSSVVHPRVPRTGTRSRFRALGRTSGSPTARLQPLDCRTATKLTRPYFPLLARAVLLLTSVLAPSCAKAAQTSSADLEAHVKWSIFHEGCRVFAGSESASPLQDKMRPIEELRTCFLRSQEHNRSASTLIASASQETLQSAVDNAVSVIPQEFQLAVNFNWVAIHEGQLPAFRRLNAAENFEGIRAIYAAAQNHNPNARHLLAAVSNRTIQGLVLALLKEAKGPPEVNANLFSSSPDDRIIAFDAQALSTRALNAVQTQLLVYAPPANWKRTEVFIPESLTEFIERQYGITTISERNEVASIVARVNDLPSPSATLERNQTLLLPPLPFAGKPSSLGGRTLQVFDLRRGEPSTSAISSTLPFLGDTPTWVLAGRPDQVEALLGRIPDEVRMSAYAGPTHQTARLILTDNLPLHPFLMPGPASAPPPSLPPARLVTDQKYYVLDFFDPATAGPCPHGQKVLDVIRQVLAQRGAGDLFATNVVPIELDFFRHQAAARVYLDEYIAHQDRRYQPLLKDTVKALQRVRLTDVDRFETPILYLQSVYAHVLSDPKALLVSSSFWTESSQFKLLPDTFIETSRTLVLSAVADPPTQPIESFTLEPIRSLYVQRRDFPILLVGGFLSTGQPFGMTSTIGDGVSLAASVEGWGTDRSCIRPSDQGTSFATPAIATTLLLGAAQQSSPIAVGRPYRDRALRAVPVLPQLAGLYQGLGPPSPDWLPFTGAIAIDLQGHPQPLSQATGYLEFFYLDSGRRAALSLGNGPGAFGGIQLVNDHVFIFNNDLSRWMEVRPRTIEVSLTRPGQAPQTARTIGEFASLGKGVLLL